MHERILILDFGSQVTQLIARRVREAGVYCEIHPCTKDMDFIREFAPRGIILSGGPASVFEDGAPLPPIEIYDLGVPILGICYGQQSICHQLGGEVTSGGTREFGRAFIDIKADTPLTHEAWPAGSRHQVWMSHGDTVTRLPEGFEIIATSEGAPYAFVADLNRHIYGVQFHLEVVHTPEGGKVISRFVKDVCGCAGDWSMASFRQEAIEKVRAQVGDGRVICALSGGVDSSVVALLLHEALGEQLTCIHVDTGLMRLGESAQVVDIFRNHYNIPLVHVDAEEEFLTALAGVTDPEQKRKNIGKLFIEIFEKEAKKIDGVQFLAQGTLYPDVIESVSFTGGPSVTIKSHHNVGGLPERMNLKLVEPVRELFKDEVRLLGQELGLPEAFISRHPFPGPGLALRLPGEVTKARLEIVRQADQVYLEEIRNAGLYDAIWQAFVVLLPVKSVGVMGDGRTYDYACSLRAVTSTDGMTADFFPFDHAFLSRVGTRIINEVRGINRVVYDITSKPPGTIEWE